MLSHHFAFSSGGGWWFARPPTPILFSMFLFLSLSFYIRLSLSVLTWKCFWICSRFFGHIVLFLSQTKPDFQRKKSQKHQQRQQNSQNTNPPPPKRQTRNSPSNRHHKNGPGINSWIWFTKSKVKDVKFKNTKDVLWNPCFVVQQQHRPLVNNVSLNFWTGS